MIEIRRVSKSYPTPHGRRYVFKDLNFSFPDNVSIGLIGPNGAGKSTLLRLLAGTEAPDHGSVRSDMRISWPVGLSGGMQGSLSGRDNARFVCRLFGATGAAMKSRLQEIEAFADIGDYFDAPVRSYSSGMRSRLAFGMSMAFDFDYYLIDEVMAVGDAEFRRKCQAAFRARTANANLILVSHNMSDIRQWCDVVVLVREGKATLYEDLEEGIVAYQGPTQPAPPRRVRAPQTPTASSIAPAGLSALQAAAAADTGTESRSA